MQARLQQYRIQEYAVARQVVVGVLGAGTMAFYLIGPFMGYGTKMEPLLALGIAFVWAGFGAFHFLSIGKVSR